MIDVKHLSKSFGDHLVLKDISEHICPGEKVVVIGPSGSGKSTFLRCLNLLETPTSGSISFDGAEITDPGADINAIRRQMGMVFQHFNLFPNMTIRKNITLAPVRTGLMSVDAGQSEAGRSLGLNYLDTMRFIVIPQAFKNILPSLGNELITLFKDTSLVSAIGGTELVYFAEAVGSKTYEYMFPYLGIALMYLVVVMVLTWLLGKLERRLRQSDRH